jgi:hypothetical protein
MRDKWSEVQVQVRRKAKPVAQAAAGAASTAPAQP